MRPEPHNEMSGQANAVLQAGTVTGNVYMHPPRGADPLAAAVARPIAEWDPFDLDVHKAIRTETSAELPELPRYARRDHDEQLAQLLGEPTRSIMVVLTGGSSTGKTRALYEVVHNHPTLREWPLLYARTADTLLALHDRVVPGTVLWLNETQNHLSGTTGETVAAWLRMLLDGSLGGPVVVLGTLWPQFWAELSNQPHARALLEHGVRRVRVAEQFSAEQLAELRADRAADPRLAMAAATSGARGHVIQTLAGGPALVERYEHPDRAEERYARAIVTAAIDAQRLGQPPLLPHALLADAAHGYLSDEDRMDPPEDWFATGLELATKDPVYGITALQPRRQQSGVGPPDGYELHDYLYQHGHTARDKVPAPESVWEALVRHTTDHQVQGFLVRNAYHRLLFRYADPLLRQFVAEGRVQLDHNLFELLTNYGRTEEALALALERYATFREDPDKFRLPQTKLLIDKLIELDHTAGLQQLAAVGVEDAQRRLADLLADRGDWAQALEVARSGSTTWNGRWIARRLGESGQVEKLRRLIDMGAGPEAEEALVEALFKTGAADQALIMLDGLKARGGQLIPGHRLIPHLVRHDRIESILQSLRYDMSDNSSAVFMGIAEAMIAEGRTEQLLSMLRTMADPENDESQMFRHVAGEALADLLAGRGEWDEVLGLLRSGATWTRQWLPKKLRELGKLDQLKRMADAMGSTARQQYIEALLDIGRSDEALAILEQAVDNNASHWYREKLAVVLSAQGKISELLSRTACGDQFCARQVVMLAHNGKLPADLLKYGLTVDGGVAHPPIG